MSAVAYNLNLNTGVPRLELLPRVAPGPTAADLVYRRRRILAGAIALGVAVLLAALVLALTPVRTADSSPRLTPVVSSAAAEWVVQPGDTLWEIVRATHPNTDPRPIVTRMAKQRGGASLQVGERIVVPL